MDSEVERLREAITSIWFAVHGPHYNGPVDRLRIVQVVLNQLAESDPEVFDVFEVRPTGGDASAG